MRALSLDTGSPRVHLELTRLYFERGWDSEAIQRAGSLRRLLQLAPNEEVSAGSTRWSASSPAALIDR